MDENKPTRILHVLGGLKRGGAEAVVMNLYRNVRREAMQFDFVIHTEEKQDYYEEVMALGGRVFHCPRYNGANHFKYKKWWRGLFERCPEYRIVHGHMTSTASIYLKIAKKNGCAAIAHSHSTSSGSGLPALVKDIFQRRLRYVADYLFACSSEAGIFLFGRKACGTERFFVVKNAINTDAYRFKPDVRERMRAALDIRDPVFVCGHVGRFHPSKNHEFLLDIFGEIQKQNRDSVLLLVGEGELRTNIEKKAAKKGCQIMLFSPA
jgi:glycosyltransferase involved in cell wall biosynthesis